MYISHQLFTEVPISSLTGLEEHQNYYFINFRILKKKKVEEQLNNYV